MRSLAGWEGRLLEVFVEGAFIRSIWRLLGVGGAFLKVKGFF